MESKPLLGQFLWYLRMVRAIFNDIRSKKHVCEMGVASIVAACPKTLASLVEFNAIHGNPALNHRNWSASYRLFSRCKWKIDRASAASAYRAVPIFFLSVPSVKIPGNASEEERKKLVEIQKKNKMSVVARELVEAIRKHLDKIGLKDKELVVCADASFSNRAFLYDELSHTSMVGRCRNDLRLVRPLNEEEKVGKKLYGERLPTPDEMYKDASVAENQFECGVMHQHVNITYKAMEDVRWPTALKNQPCSIVAIRGQYYRKYGKRQHTHPAFLEGL